MLYCLVKSSFKHKPGLCSTVQNTSKCFTFYSCSSRRSSLGTGIQDDQFTIVLLATSIKNDVASYKDINVSWPFHHTISYTNTHMRTHKITCMSPFSMRKKRASTWEMSLCHMRTVNDHICLHSCHMRTVNDHMCLHSCAVWTGPLLSGVKLSLSKSTYKTKNKKNPVSNKLVMGKYCSSNQWHFYTLKKGSIDHPESLRECCLSHTWFF